MWKCIVLDVSLPLLNIQLWNHQCLSLWVVYTSVLLSQLYKIHDSHYQFQQMARARLFSKVQCDKCEINIDLQDLNNPTVHFSKLAFKSPLLDGFSSNKYQ